MAKKTLHRIPDDAIMAAGFEREVEFDRDLSVYENVMLVTFTKPIAQSLKVEVCYYYRAEVQGEFNLIEATTELRLGDEDLKLNIHEQGNIIRFTDNLLKTIKPALK